MKNIKGLYRGGRTADLVAEAASQPPAPVDGSASRQQRKIKKVTCPCCHGSGTQHSSKSGMRELCPACDARGWIENPNY